jgi:putative ABC transport system substrate-binding protein
MKRREFIGLIGGATAAWPLAARAQEAARTYHLAFLIPVARSAPGIVAFLDELRLHGFVEGQNLSLLPLGFEVRNDQIAETAQTLIKAGPDAILCGGDVAIRTVQQATRTIPILGMTEDMVAAGLVSSLARPGGNTTGISLLSPELDSKRLELLLEGVPRARRVAALSDSSTLPGHIESLHDAVRSRGILLTAVSVGKPDEIGPAIVAAKAAGAEALNVLSSPMLYLNRRIIIERALEQRLPAIYQWPEMAAEGGLIAYGPRFLQLFRQRARMTAKVLRGAKPADLPVEQPARFELVVNLKVAKAIDHEIPSAFVLRADEVIE